MNPTWSHSMYASNYPLVSEVVPSAPDRKDVKRSCNLFRSFVTIACSSLEGGGCVRGPSEISCVFVIRKWSPFGRGGTAERR